MLVVETPLTCIANKVGCVRDKQQTSGKCKIGENGELKQSKEVGILMEGISVIRPIINL